MLSCCRLNVWEKEADLGVAKCELDKLTKIEDHLTKRKIDNQNLTHDSKELTSLQLLQKLVLSLSTTGENTLNTNGQTALLVISAYCLTC